MQGFPKRLTDRKAERSVTYAPSIDKEKLVVRAWTGGFWQSEHAPQGQTWRSFRQSSEGSIDSVSETVAGSLVQSFGLFTSDRASMISRMGPTTSR